MLEHEHRRFIIDESEPELSCIADLRARGYVVAKRDAVKLAIATAYTDAYRAVCLYVTDADRNAAGRYAADCLAYLDPPVKDG